MYRKIFVLRGLISELLARYFAQFRVFGKVRVGLSVKIHKGALVYCDNQSEVIISDHVILHKNVKVIAQSGQRIYIGAKTTVQEFGHIEGNVRIGENCVIAPRVYISTTSHTFNIRRGMLIKDQDALKTPKMDKLIFIGSNCWIGIDSKILGNVTIGNDSVVGAGSLITNYKASDNSLIVQNNREIEENRILYKQNE